MAMHPDFPTSPHEIIDPLLRWYPSDAQLGEMGYQNLLPPLVHDLRKRVKEWRDSGYVGAKDTSIALLNRQNMSVKNASSILRSRSRNIVKKTGMESNALSLNMHLVCTMAVMNRVICAISMIMRNR